MQLNLKLHKNIILITLVANLRTIIINSTLKIQVEVILNRNELLKKFSYRLIKSLKSKGLESFRSKTQVRISELSKVCGCSHQMARRYVIGDALPDIEILVKMAIWLEVSPSWLLFGEEGRANKLENSDKVINIEEKVLEYILIRVAPLFSTKTNPKELIAYIMDIINDINKITVDKPTLYKIIDISIESAMRFKDNVNKNGQIEVTSVS